MALAILEPDQVSDESGLASEPITSPIHLRFVCWRVFSHVQSHLCCQLDKMRFNGLLVVYSLEKPRPTSFFHITICPVPLN